MKKKLAVLVLALAMVLSMAACGNDTSAEKDNTQLNIIDSEWRGLDTYQLDETAGAQRLNAEPLFQWDPETNTMVDNVCTDWQVSEDGKTATFNVPEGMTYSTGEQVEPEDVVASIQHGLDVSPYSDGYGNIESMEVDGRQVILHLTQFRSDMQYYFCAGFVTVIDKDELDTMTDEELMWECHPYGMYALAENGYISGSEVKLVKNEDFVCANPLVENQGAGHFENVSVRFNVEEFTQTEDLKAGNVDMLMSVSESQKMDLEAAGGFKLEDTTYPNIDYFEINTDSPIFSDINVRTALALSIDREALVDVVDGMIAPAYSMITESMQNYDANAAEWFKENLANDPERAKELLEESGWVDSNGDGIREKDGQTLSFTFLTWTSTTSIPEAMSEQLKEVGFDMKIETMDSVYLYNTLEADDYDAGIEWKSWAEPMLIFDACYSDPNNPGNNDQHYADVKKAATTLDTDERTAMVGQIQMNMFEHVSIIPWFSELSFTALNGDLQGYNVLADGTAPLNDLSY